MAKETIPIPEITEEIKQRFLSKIAYTDNSNNCWEWLDSIKGSYYGKISFKLGDKKYIISSHRMSYYIHNNEDPIGNVILHKCDNGKCVNPNHLYLGTHKDNSRDMISKGRGKEQFKNGENHKNSKLTEKIVLEIRRKNIEDGLQSTELAKMYGICQPAMSRIINRKRWSHI